MPSPTVAIFRSEYVHTQKEFVKGHIEIFMVNRDKGGTLEYAYVVHDKMSATTREGNRTTTATTDTLETFPHRETAVERAHQIIAFREEKGFVAVTVKDMDNV
jgi:hypothetical protein